MTTAMFIITSDNKTPQSLRRHSCLHLLWRWNNWWQLTRGGSEVRHQCSLCWNASVNQQSWEGPPSVWRHTARFEKGITILVDKKKNTGWIFIIIGYTHYQHRFQFKQLVKMQISLYDPFNFKNRYYHVILKTGVMVAENSALNHRNVTF